MAIKSDAQRRAVAKYIAANYEQILLRVKKGKKAVIVEHARKTDNGRVNEFINRAIDETIERDNAANE